MLTNWISIGIGIIGFAAAGFVFWKSLILQKDLRKKEEEIRHRVYELAILKELGDRIGYSLDVQQIIDVIIGSLHQFLDYGVVSYMLLEPEKIIFKAHLEKSVHRKFVDEIKDRMLQSISALAGKEFKNSEVEELISGAILVEDLYDPVKSFFNIPIVIANKVMGVLTIADTKEGLFKEQQMTILYRIMQQASNAVSKLEEVVQTEQRKLNSMLESITEGVVMTDNDYRIVVANPAVKIAVGIPEDKEDVTIFDFIDRLGGKLDIRGKLEESVTLDKVLSVNDVLINDKFYKVFVSPVKSSQGVSRGVLLGSVVVFLDITKEKEVEQLREDFTSMMVHELRSPLDGIKKRIEVIQESSAGRGKKKAREEMTRAIYENASHMLDLVNDLLDVAKIEAGKMEFHKEPINIKKIIEDRISFYSFLAKGNNLELKSQIASNIPEQINIDPLRMYQVFNNLISNAIKFNNSGGEINVQALLHKKTGDILKEAELAGIKWHIDSAKEFAELADSLVIAITDTGVGISEKDIPNLFNKFKQFKNTAATKDKKGTGLGLVIAKAVVEGHGGTIGVASKESVGTTFYFTIPI